MHNVKSPTRYQAPNQWRIFLHMYDPFMMRYCTELLLRWYCIYFWDKWSKSKCGKLVCIIIFVFSCISFYDASSFWLMMYCYQCIKSRFWPFMNELSRCGWGDQMHSCKNWNCITTLTIGKGLKILIEFRMQQTTLFHHTSSFVKTRYRT